MINHDKSAYLAGIASCFNVFYREHKAPDLSDLFIADDNKAILHDASVVCEDVNNAFKATVALHSSKK